MAQPSRATSPTAPTAPGSDLLNDLSLRIEAADAGKPGAWRTTARTTAIMGLVFVALYLVSFYLLARTPLGKATDAEILAYYGDGKVLTLSLTGMLVLPFVGIFFLYFMLLLRATVRSTGHRASRVLENAQIITGAIFVALLFVTSAALLTMPAGMRYANLQTDPVAARIMPIFGMTVLLGFGMRMASMFVITSTSLGRATGLIPGWFAYVGYAVGLVLLLAYAVTAWFALLFPTWVFVVCVLMLWQRRRVARAGETSQVA